MDKTQWDQGWQDGYAFALKNFNPVTGYSIKFPDRFIHIGDAWSCGFAEGEICGHGEIFDRYYKVKGKQLISIAWQNGQYVARYKE